MALQKLRGTIGVDEHVLLDDLALGVEAPLDAARPTFV